MVESAVTLRPQPGASPVIRSPQLIAAMKITARGARVEDIRFEFLHSAIWILADDVRVTDCAFHLADEVWRTSSCGMWIAGAKRATISGNTFTGCGMALAGPPISQASAGLPVLTAMFEVGEDKEFFTTHTVENNTVNQRPLCFLRNQSEADWRQGAGQIIAVECDGLVIQGLNLDFSSIGIQLAYCKNVRIADCTADDNGVFGIYVMKSEDCDIVRTRADRGAHGIDVRDATRIDIRKCVANDSGQGIFLSWGHNCLVRDCAMLRNGTGFLPPRATTTTWTAA